ncbi:MAG TPA: ABC transporter substrate-binding protein [Candidatus Paceibacterota bacterium]
MKRILYIAGSVAVIAILIISNGGSNANKDREIVIGAALSLSGAAVQDGESIKSGLELARADLKAEGIEVRIIYQDDKTEPKNVVGSINALAAQGVEAIVGPTWSYLADAGVPVADSLKIVTVMPANTSEYVNARSDYAFYTTTKIEKMLPVLSEWISERDKKKVAVISGQGSWYQVVRSGVQRAVKDAGAEIVLSEEIPYGADSSAIASALSKVKAAKADVLFFEVDDEQAIFSMLKKVREQKIPVDILSVTTAVERVKGDLKIDNGVYALAPETSEEFKAKYEAAYGKLAPAYADSAYDSLMLLVDAIRNRDEMTLASYLRFETDYKGFAKEYDFDARGDIIGGAWVVRDLR